MRIIYTNTDSMLVFILNDNAYVEFRDTLEVRALFYFCEVPANHPCVKYVESNDRKTGKVGFFQDLTK